MRKIKKQEQNKNQKTLKDKVINSKDGITLIALVITIVVLLILASVSIAMLTGDNGILTKAGDAKIETALGTVKEQVRLYQIEKKMNEQEVTAESLLAEGKVSRTVQAGEDNQYYMYYALKDNSFEGMQGLGKGNIASLKDVFLIDDNLNIKYIASSGKEYGDNLNNKVLEDETEIRFSSKAFSEYVSKISGVTEDEMKFKWMKNQTSLVITDSNIDSLQDLVFFPNLKVLQLGNDYSGKIAPNITSLEGIENCKNLTSITIIQGPHKDYSALKPLTNLEYFNKYGEENYDNIIDNLKFCKNLKKVILTKLNIKDMSRIAELSNLTSLTLKNNEIEKIEGLENMTNLSTLDLSFNKISKLQGLENLNNLETLYLNGNEIIDITPLSKNQKLVILDLRDNTKIDANRENYKEERLEALNKIGGILEKDGGVIKLDIDKLKLFNNYKQLDLSSQRLTTLEPLEGLTQLTKLDLSYNQLTLQDEKSQNILKSMKNLIELNLAENNIANATSINSLSKLKKLHLLGKNNRINLVEIEDIISNLDSLTISTESLKSIVNCDVNKITKLNLPRSGLTEIPDLTKFVNLNQISLYRNPKIQNYNGILNLPNLKTLVLSQNDLHGKKLDFSKLKSLTRLDLSYNNLWSEDLDILNGLKNNKNLTIVLNDNSIIDTTELLNLDSSCKIELYRNINLSQDSKNKLKAKFGSNVVF